MRKIFLNEYEPYLKFSSLLPSILTAISDPNYDLDFDTLQRLAEKVNHELKMLDWVTNERMKDTYYEYQQLSLAIEHFVMMYGAICLHFSESSDRVSQLDAIRLFNKKTRVHGRNFLNTQKVE